MKKQIFVSILLASLPFAAFAEETQTSNTSTVKASEVQNKDEQQKDIDEEITNARMRATLGAKSKWSFKGALSYSGGSIEKPFDRIRPNYRASASAEALTGLSGTVGVNLRDGGNNFSFGTGITVLNPLHGDMTRGKFDDPRISQAGKTKNRVDVATPYLSWSRGYKALGLQMISGTTYSHYTTEDATELYNAIGGISLSQTVLADLGQSSWSAGVSLSADASIYKGQMEKASYLVGYRQDDYGFGLFPFAEYTFNDKLSFRTVFGYFQYVHYKANSVNTEAETVRLTPYQSVGVGISITRDIYLYPNVQFVPEDARPDRTNVALSANINL